MKEEDKAVESTLVCQQTTVLAGKPKFPLGRTVATPGALEALEAAGQSAFEFLTWHSHGDWGDVCEDDRRENELSLKKGFRLMSVYQTKTGQTLWVITEADRSSTCLLLPAEY